MATVNCSFYDVFLNTKNGMAKLISDKLDNNINNI